MRRNYTVGMVRIRANASTLAWAEVCAARALARMDGDAAGVRGSALAAERTLERHNRVNDYEHRKIDAMVCEP